MTMHKPSSRLRTTLIVIVPTLAATILVSAFRWKDENDYYYKVNKGLEVFGQVYREVTQNYVDQIDPDEFIAAGIEGMLKTLDPYTVYLRKREAADIDLLTTGAYGGIGITVGMRDSMVTIIDVLDGYSAQAEGIRIGDRIISINGADVARGPVEALRDHTRGEPGSTLTITIGRDGVEKPLTFTLTRENIKVYSVGHSGMVGEGIGYIRLERFGANAGDELRSAFIDLKRKGAVGGIILDLRDNPGGLLESAVDVASKFVPNGSIVVSTRGRDTSEDRVYRSHEEPIAYGVPLVVLVNDGSASAAEIVAGAIQDLDAGVIMGTQSYGKGLVQTVRRLPYESSLKITTARYYTPSGRSIQKVDYTMQRTGTSSFELDSINRSFRTARGRAVTQHGGILPDTVVDSPTMPTIVERLRQASAFFKFASRYASSLRALPDNFAVDNSLLKQFEDFAIENSQASNNDSSALAWAKSLRDAAKAEGYDQNLLRRIEELESSLALEERELMARHRDAIRRELQNEIASRFRGQRERRIAMLSGDPQIQSAAALLRTGRQVYSRMLSAR
jgi:carboxyl-terminal processing protease